MTSTKYSFKLLSVFLFVALFQISELKAQTKPLQKQLNLSSETTTIEKALEKIMKKTNCVFTYSNKLPLQREIKIKGGKKSVLQYLKEIFEGEELQFIEKGNKIIIVPKDIYKKHKYFQTIRGQVLDKDTKIPLIGVNVVVKSINPIIGGTTDNNGNFRIENVSLGRHEIEASYIGYKSKNFAGLLISSAKEKVLRIELEPVLEEISEIVVTPDLDKTKPLNNMTSVSSRSFSVEETRRFAGGIDDPGRMVTSFAGVASGGYTENNAIIIRGNSPKGVLWRLEGVEVNNPNHFAGLDYTGAGAVTIFSAQMLDNSDFFTGAFPAEFGNVNSGVFDIKFRNGNNEKREYTFQAGVLGFDFAAEGPFVKGKRASYLLNYRYSTLGVLKNFLSFQQIPEYQDLSFKLNFPTKKAGVFSFWGLGGYDNTTKPEVADPEKWETFEDRHLTTQKIWNGAMGLNHKLILSNKTYLNSSIAATTFRTNDLDEFMMDFLYLKKVDLIEQTEGKYSAAVNLNHKFGKRHTNKTGIIFNKMFYDIDIQYATNSLEPLTQYVKENGSSNFIQAFTQSKYRLSDKLILNVGLHSHLFTFNNNYSIEPRAGLRWNFVDKHTLSFGYGLHSRLEELKIYFVRNEENNPATFPNKDLKLTKSHHYVLAYEWQINDNLFLKVEPYYQQLVDVPVIENSTYSFINYTNERYFNDSVINAGTATNMGIDITLERYLKNNFYYLITASIFDSKYKGGDGVERNSRYNRNFIINLLAGKEFYVGKNEKNNIFGINGRINFSGGTRYVPIHEEYTQLTQRTIYDYDKAFEAQWPSKLSVDLTLTYRINKAKYSSVWALQIVNLLGTKNYYGHIYNYAKNTVEEDIAQFILPILSYKIEF